MERFKAKAMLAFAHQKRNLDFMAGLGQRISRMAVGRKGSDVDRLFAKHTLIEPLLLIVGSR